MRARPLIWLALGVIGLVGVLSFWRLAHRPIAGPPGAPSASIVPDVASRPHRVANTNPVTVSEATAPAFLAGATNTSTVSPTNHLAHRLTNTTKTVGQLLRDDHAVLLENALIDTAQPAGFSIPEYLRNEGDPGSYIVQSHGPVDNAFRAALAAAGATIVAYIPNNSYLVRASAAAAGQLTANARLIQAVLPYEPVYKLKDELLGLGLENVLLEPGTRLNVMAFPDARGELAAELARRGLTVQGESSSPFGSVFTVQPGEGEAWTELARLASVEVIEVAAARIAANDLSRPRIAVATDSRTPDNYLGLTGTNVLVNINDTGVSKDHPDLLNRVFPEFPYLGTDDNGHGTFVAGIIAGDGTESLTVTNARGSINPGTNYQYRGKAPGAKLYVQSSGDSDQTLQEGAALTNALISNNSWNYGANNYGIAAASYDAAVRDALPGRTGSQPVLFVFSAGNAGGGNDSGLSGKPQTVLSPGTAKNVITVGATELPRDITNVVTKITPLNTNTSTPWKGMTSSGNQIAAFSSRGNVGIGIEGEFGRFKPDVVSPGTFVVSTRSTTWDEKAYYNPTSHIVAAFQNLVTYTNSFFTNSIFLYYNAVGFSLQVFANRNSPDPFPDLPIFVRRDAVPRPLSTAEFVRTNAVFVPPDGGGVGADVDQYWHYVVGNLTTQNVSFDMVTDIAVTNDLGDYYTVLSNLNNSISGTEPYYYRYESGTSMSAGDASGTLALMQEFFELNQQMPTHITNSPALMKALLINGARSVSSLYDFQVQNSINFQGWGLIKLANSLPGSLTNYIGGLNNVSNSMFLFDQSPTNALATAQSQTRLISVNEDGQTLPLRITLVWTDPPGNPAAGVKLVNDLDLIVTNLDTGEIFFGNDIPVNSTLTYPWDTNVAPNIDLVNNVENVYLDRPLGSNYSITVFARRVNVNAVYAQTNDVVQDYALVISSGNGEVPDALHLDQVLPVNLTNAVHYPEVTVVTNQFAGNPTVGGGILLGQLVGANTPLLGTTNGMTNQWHFYMITNDVGFTNAAFVTFLPPTHSVPREGVFADDLNNASRVEADIDLYVSQDFNLTNLSPSAIAAADKSRTREGTEFVAYSNSTAGAVYYIGVKSEDQMASEYAFFAGFSLLPFSEGDGNGNWIVNGFPLPSVIPDGSPSHPGASLVLGLAIQPALIRRLIVTNSYYHEQPGDIISTLSHSQKFAVLQNHRGDPPGQYTEIYEDNDEDPASTVLRHPDGPGKLRDFVGDQATGVWLFSTVDDSLSHTGVVNGLKILIEPSDTSGGTTNVVHGRSFFYEFVDVPVGATNLEICVNIVSANPSPMELYVRYEAFPTRTAYDQFRTINPPGDCLNITPADLPPLRPGRYFIGVYNPVSRDQEVTIKATVTIDPRGVIPINWNGEGNQSLLDDAITNFSTFVTNNARIAQLEVGLRIDHPRVSDLAVTLISPRGTRVLLVENRGGTTTNGFGSSLIVTNIFPSNKAGNESAHTNVIDTGAPVGTLTIDYNFFCEPDFMHVYYEGNRIFDSGLTNNGCPPPPAVASPRRVTVSYGPGSSTEITIIMNEGGNTNVPTAWEYSAYSISDLSSYLIFTENTNLTTTPIKFAMPPFVGPAGATTNISDFEPPQAPGDFSNSPPLVDGWSVLTAEPVAVLNGTPPANTGVQSLSLQAGQIQRALPTIPRRNYRLNFAYRRVQPLDSIVSWWPGNGNAEDIVGNHDGAALFGAGYGVGMVGLAFDFDGTTKRISIPDDPDFALTNSLTIECWVYPRANNGLIFFRGDNRPGFDPYALDLSTQGNVGFQIVDGANQAIRIVAPIQYNQWQHVAGTLDGATGDMRLYVNGIPVTQTNTPIRPLGALDPTQDPAIGIGNHGGTFNNFPINGMVDEAAIFSRALTPAEILGIYTDGAGGKCAGLPLLINMDFGAGPLTGPSPKAGPAAVGQAPNDFWNFYSRGDAVWRDNGAITDMRLANGLGTGVGLTVLNAQGAWGNGSLDYMYNSYLYPLPNGPGFVTATITNLPAGIYDIYVYSHNGNYQLTAGTAGYGTQTTFDPNTGGTTPVWQQGVQYALYKGVIVTNSSQPVTIVARPGVGDVAMIAGIQILGTSIFQPPAVCGPPLGTQIFVPGQVTNSFLGTTNWQPGGLVFSSTTSNTLVGLSPVMTNGESGVLVDTFTLTEAASPRYVLPEESLDILRGENAYGLWQLEIWDSRTGATNQVSLIDWQLQFVFLTDTASARRLTPGVPVTTTIPTGQIAYYTVDVPIWVSFATNILFNASGQLTVRFNQDIPPSFGGTNVAPSPDYVLIGPDVTSGVTTISSNTTPPLQSGRRYYLGVENTSGATVTYTIMVDFDLVSIPPFVVLTNGVEYCTVNPAPLQLDYYLYTVSSNAVRAQFEILNPSGDMTLFLRQGLPPTFTVFDYLSANPFTNIEVITVFDFTQPVPLTPGDWYLAAANISTNPVSYCVKATEWSIYGTNIVITNWSVFSNSFCITWTSLPGVHYFVEGVTDLSSTNWVTVSPTITATSYSTTYCIPLPSPFHFFRVREGIALNVYISQPVITSIKRVLNGYLVSWGGPTSAQYQVQWSPTLNTPPPLVWTGFTNPAAVTSATGLFQYLDDGTQTGGLGPMRFYRLLVLP